MSEGLEDLFAREDSDNAAAAALYLAEVLHMARLVLKAQFKKG